MGQNKGKHFNITKRNVLSKMISSKKEAKDIAIILDMSATSISREVLRNRYELKSKQTDTICSGCKLFNSCRLKHLCGSKECGQMCSGCKVMKKCLSFVTFNCNINKRWPLCCNGCIKQNMCHLTHYFYYPDDAEIKSRHRLIDLRSGVDMSEDEHKEIDDILYNSIVNKGQSVHQTIIANNDKIKCSEKTIYRMIENGIFKVKNFNLPRKPGLKKRNHKKIPNKYDYNHKNGVDRTGHLYSDWLVYRVTHSIINYFQMDFLGKPMASSKEILVLTMPLISFTLLYIIENSTSEKVAELFESIENELSIELFKKIFQTILTDRDVVFDDYSTIEFDKNGEARTSIFFCEPGASNQKPHVENMNGQLKVPFPKKSDFKWLYSR